MVTLRQRGAAWVPTGARTPTIEVDAPTSGATVRSPLSVTGRAHSYEGTVTITLVEARPGKYTEVGRGFAIGGGNAMRPFSAEVDSVEHESERG